MYEFGENCEKKVNPRRIPLPRNAINKDAIIEEAMKDDMAHAWLLVAGPLLDRGYDLPPLADAVSAYVNKNTDKPANRAMLARAEKALGYSRPNLDTRNVKSPVELEAFKRKVWRVAMETALCVVYLGLEGLAGCNGNGPVCCVFGIGEPYQRR